MAPVDGSRSLGDHLRSLREGAGMSLAEMARFTRINREYLAAMERSDFSALPPPTFVRGFIRAYCGALQAPADDAVALYHAQSGAPAMGAAVVRSLRRGPSWMGHPLVVSVALLAVFGAGVLALNLVARSPAAPPLPAPAGRTLQPREAPGGPGLSSGLLAPAVEPAPTRP